VGLGASPLGAGLVIGLVAVAAALVAVKLAAALIPIPAVYVPYANVIAALAMLGGGAAALAVRSPRPRLAHLAVGQLGWVAAVVGSLRVRYIRSQLEESRRGAAAALPTVTACSTAGGVAFCLVIAAYGAFGYPILGLADQGAEALGLK